VFVIIIQDQFNNCFGFYGSERIRNSIQYQYYGNGECFLYTFRPEVAKEKGVAIYNSSRMNDYFMINDAEGLHFGGGHHYGLWLDSDLCSGITYES